MPPAALSAVPVCTTGVPEAADACWSLCFRFGFCFSPPNICSWRPSSGNSCLPLAELGPRQAAKTDAASICTPLDDWACRCLLAALPPIGVHCSLPGNIPTREAAMVRRLSEAGRGSPPINLLRK